MAKFIDETNNKYGRLLVQYRVPNTSPIKWHCLCECGKEIDVLGTSLRNGNTKSCGCYKHDQIAAANASRAKPIMIGTRFNSLIVLEVNQDYSIKCKCDCGTIKNFNRTDLINGHTKTCGCLTGIINPNYKNEIGNRYGNLTVIGEAGRNKDNRVLWKCLCDCGCEKIVLGKSLRQGLVKSCGCIHSIGEQKIAQILSELNINFERQKTFPTLLSPNSWHLYCDFYLPDYNIIIEYQGEQHYKYTNKGWNNQENFSRIQQYDQIKRDFCKNNNLYLIEISYLDFPKINKQYIQEVVNNEDSRN